MIHNSVQRSCSLTCEYYLLSKLYIPYSGKNCIDLNVNLSKCIGLGSAGRLMKKTENYYINLYLNDCYCLPNKSNSYTAYTCIPRASMELEGTSDAICSEQIFILLHCHLIAQVP